MNDNNKDGQDPPSIQPLEARFGCDEVTRVDRPRAALSRPSGQSATERSAVAPLARISGTRLRRALVLVAHDYADVRESCADGLRTMGFRTAQAESGVLAVELARALMPDVILLDFATLQADGVQTALRLKSGESTRCIPILMLTASGERPEGALICDAYLEKPCAPHLVAIALQSLVQLRLARVDEGG